EVGFKVIDQYTFELTLTEGIDMSEIVQVLSSGSTGVVHQTNYEAGMNIDRTATTYGTIINPPVSYGPYILSNWEQDTIYQYTLNPLYRSSSQYSIKYIDYTVFSSTQNRLESFNQGLIDYMRVDGSFFIENDFSDHNLEFPTTTQFRLVLNIEETNNPILKQNTFRQALYLAIDRADLSAYKVPSLPAQGFLSAAYASTIYNHASYRLSQPGLDVLSDYSPSTYGYDPIRAKALFDQAYDAAVLAGDIEEGDIVSIEFKHVESYLASGIVWQTWFKDKIEAIFNQGETTPIFELNLIALSTNRYNEDIQSGAFEMISSAWMGLTYTGVDMLGLVYNSEGIYMKERGFDTGNQMITVALPNSKIALGKWIDAYELLESPTLYEQMQYDKWVLL
ncbi:MAG: hypothetical protein CVV63_04885, partial [Tenericutes bacterium HGW-Tenericutes-8]